MLRIDRDKLIDMYRKMIKIRNFEDKVYDLVAQNLIPGTVHSYAGEEAVAVGVCATLRGDDYITSTHRGHGHCIAKGIRLDKLMAELFGRKTGYCKGKGGSMHLFDLKNGILGTAGIVGAGIPIATGAGLSMKLRGTDQVVVCFFGEGATNTGEFHEAVNLAAVWQLPVIFVCENNLYAFSTRQSEAMLIENIAERASAYGMPGMVVDGNDVLAVFEVAQKAVERARKGEGPTLIECKTYRHKGHSRYDASKYRPEEEVEAWLKKDPIPRFKERLISMGVVSERGLQKIEQEAMTEIEEAVKFASESPWPETSEVLDDI